VCDCTLPCDLSSITISVSDRRLFYDIRVSQGSVATRMMCGVISNYNFTPNLPLTQSTEEFWHRFGVFLFVEHSANKTTILINGIILCFMFYYMFLHLLHNLMPGGDLRVIYCCRDRGYSCKLWTDGTRDGRRQWTLNFNGSFPPQLLEKHRLYSMPTTALSVQNGAGTAWYNDRSLLYCD